MSAAFSEPLDRLPRSSPEPRSEYERDYFSWANAQAALLREGRWSELDIANLAEEIESLAKSERSALRSYLSLVLMHMLKWDHQPAKRTSSWRTSILIHRRHAARELKDNPGLKPELEGLLDEAYASAVLMAADETGLVEQQFPRHRPYGFDEMMSREYERP